MEATTIEKRAPGRPSRPRVAMTIYARPDQAERLRELADARDVPQACLIRQAIDRLLAEASAE